MTPENTYPTLTAGSTIIITKGCAARNVQKGMRGKILEVIEGDRRSACVRIEFPTRYSESKNETGSVLRFYVQHVNRLNDLFPAMNDGNPSHRIEVRRA